MIFGRRTITVHGKLLERGLGKEAEVESFGFFCFLGKEIWGSGSLGLRSGGCRQKKQRRRGGGDSRR
jgi:hypothetical protein